LPNPGIYNDDYDNMIFENQYLEEITEKPAATSIPNEKNTLNDLNLNT